MFENATHIFIHHNIEGASSLLIGMLCCIILAVIIVVLLIIILGFVIYIIVCSKKSEQPIRSKRTSRNRGNRSFKNLMDGASSPNEPATPVSTVQDLDAHISPNGQAIPMSTFKRHSQTNDRAGESSESSAGLYDVLFPDRHGGEIICEPPKRLVTFAGQVYASGGHNSEAGPSTSGLNRDDVSESLAWDYFQPPNSRSESVLNSEAESEVEVKRIQTVCWV